MTDRTQFHLRRLENLRSRRGNWETQWEEAASYVIPAHSDSFFGRGANNAFGASGQKKTEQQYDSTAAIACQRFSAVIESLATPQSGIWHKLAPVDKMLRRNRKVRMFFDDLNDLLFNYRYRPVANFVANSQQVYMGLGAYGNGVLFVDAPDKSRGLRYKNIHLGEAYFVENHAGVVDTLYRSFYKTSAQAFEQWGSKCPEQFIDQAKSSTQSQTNHEFVHVVAPRMDWMPGRLDAQGKEWESIYLSVETNELISEGGYDSFPYAVARYTQASGEIYGRGPAQWVLPAIKVLNEEKKTVLKQGHRIVDPVLLAYDDGNLGSFSLKAGALNPGGVNADGRELIKTLPTGNLTVGDKLMEMERTTINDAFLITLFQILVDSPQMTATEVLERAREKGMLVAPTAGRLQSEFLGPLIERELDLLARQGLLPEMPAILRDSEAAEYKIEYDSPMSRMQRAEKAAGFMRALDVAANYAKNTNDPAPLDFFDFDQAMPDILDIHGSPVAWTRSPDAVAALRAERAKQMQQQQMIDAAPAMAGLLKSAPDLANGGK